MPRSFLVKTKQQQQQQRYDVTNRTSSDVNDDAGDVRLSRRLSQSTVLSDTQCQLHTGQYISQCGFQQNLPVLLKAVRSRHETCYNVVAMRCYVVQFIVI